MLNRKTVLALSLIMFAMIFPGLQPQAMGVACERTITGIYIPLSGRLVVRTETPGGKSDQMMTLCYPVSSGPRIAPEVCSMHYTNLLVAMVTGGPVRFVFDDNALAVGNLWDGTCEGLVQWGDFESAIQIIEPLAP